jgi:four helix bundle protein
MGAKTFEELRAWQLAATLSDRVIAICATGALRADLDFRDQFREAAESAPRLIAEGFGRWGHREFSRYLVMARAEVMEVKSDLLALQRRRTVDASVLSELLQLSDDTIKTINRLRSSL